MATKPLADPLRAAILSATPRQSGFSRVWNPLTKTYDYKLMTAAEQLRASSSR
jgi:hypothetical protein